MEDNATIDQRTSISTGGALPKLQQRLEELGIDDNVEEIRRQGYTVIPDIATPEFTARLRETCLRLAGGTFTAAKLLGRNPIFEEVVLNPRLLAMVEAMVGSGALLSQLIASVRGKGAPALRLHADIATWMQAPFPVQNQLLTMCWTMDEFSRAAGATKVVPGTHVHRRTPTKEETSAEQGAEAIECAANSLACWDGSVWHGNWPRELEGERVVLHITFGRIALRTVENYDHLDNSWLAGKAPQLATMLGRNDHFGKSTEAGPDFPKLMYSVRAIAS